MSCIVRACSFVRACVCVRRSALHSLGSAYMHDDSIQTVASTRRKANSSSQPIQTRI
jgi:hypothetical protein